MKKNLTYWILILLTTYGLTFGIEYLVRPLWFIKGEETYILGDISSVFYNYSSSNCFGNNSLLIGEKI